MPYISIIGSLRVDLLAPLSPIIAYVLCEQSGSSQHQPAPLTPTPTHASRTGLHTHTHTFNEACCAACIVINSVTFSHVYR